MAKDLRHVYTISLLQEITGLNNTQIAKAIGINHSLFSKWMNGDRFPSREQLESVSESLGECFSEALEDPSKFELFTKSIPLLYKVRDFEGRKRFIKHLIYLSFISSMAPLEDPMFGVRFTVTGREVLMDLFCFLLMDPQQDELEDRPIYSSLMMDKALQGADLNEFIVNRQDKSPFTLHQNMVFEPGHEVKLLDNYHFIYLQVLEPLFDCHFYLTSDESIMNIIVLNDITVVVRGIETNLPIITFIKQHMISVNYRNYIRKGMVKPISTYYKAKNILDLMKVFLAGEDYYYIESSAIPSIFLDTKTLIKYTSEAFKEETIIEITNLFKRAMTCVEMTVVLPDTVIDDFLDTGIIKFGFYHFTVPIEDRVDILENFMEYIETYSNINISLTTRNVQIPLSFSEKGMVNLRKDSKVRKVHRMDFGTFNEALVKDIVEKMKPSRRYRPLVSEEIIKKIRERRLDDVL